MSDNLQTVPQGYDELLNDLKVRIRQARIRAGLAVNRELVLLYWQIGKEILVRQYGERWGSGVIERLARDLRAAFPGVQGFSARNLWRMRAFCAAYADSSEILPQPVAELPPDVLLDIPWDTTS